MNLGGKPGIRTLETLLTSAGFQDCRVNYNNQHISYLSFPQLRVFTKPTARMYQGAYIGLRK